MDTNANAETMNRIRRLEDIVEDLKRELAALGVKTATLEQAFAGFSHVLRSSAEAGGCGPQCGEQHTYDAFCRMGWREESSPHGAQVSVTPSVKPLPY